MTDWLAERARVVYEATVGPILAREAIVEAVTKSARWFTGESAPVTLAGIAPAYGVGTMPPSTFIVGSGLLMTRLTEQYMIGRNMSDNLALPQQVTDRTASELRAWEMLDEDGSWKS